ncbi:hypothetical protein KHQ06_33350 [Nocardia tengchongensis]|uniref:Uncharacterized protein n=1 Tax=Nocardia tengchongensis TaxID=2055889 RepID=A0ABX8CLS1_9NOCA|nr:hypothetical protein [Nocardia tengchongensis]QVI20914.1 hypothetical protein KHQ06_33350 [Nocardia tengchongensis]
MTDPWTYGETDPTEEFCAKLEAAYGPDWLDALPSNLRIDHDAEPVELPSPDEEIIRVRRIFLRLPWTADERLEAIGRDQGLTPAS